MEPENITSESNTATGEWSVYEDGYGILEWHPKHKDGVAMLCRCRDRIEAEYTVNAHNAALADLKSEWHKDLRRIESLEKQLSAEREKANPLVDCLTGIRAALVEAGGFSKTVSDIDSALEDVKK